MARNCYYCSWCYSCGTKIADMLNFLKTSKSVLKKIVKNIVDKIVPLDTYIRYQQKLMNRLWEEEVIPKYAYVSLQNELSLALLRTKSQSAIAQYKNAKDLLVNIGAGSLGKPRWVNVDLYDAPGINCIYDCRQSLPFPDNSVKGIFTEHFFEHIDYIEEVPCFLSECHRVLQPGGVIRIIVPDAEKYLNGYCKAGWEELSKTRPLDSEHTDFYFNFKYNTKIQLINFVFRQNYEHKYAYDYETLELILSKSGFSSVQRQEFGKSLMDELCIDQQIRASESLYVEAVK